ncbi:hypothetical protein GGR54DRAFT_636103 [Hypoxylon sp. NC1633]|nr:hypothetical protein GGR54DRAFT_636103 [Hypoxylon sp. NC1633]
MCKTAWWAAKVPHEIDPNGVPAWSKARGEGFVNSQDMFLCMCGSVCKNTTKDIGSHFSKLHKCDSAYRKAQFSSQERFWDCPGCLKRFGNFNGLDSHLCRDHEWRGSSSVVKDTLDPWKPLSNLDREFLESLRH